MRKVWWLIFLFLLGFGFKKTEAIDNMGVYISPPFIDMVMGATDAQKDFVLELGNNSPATIMVNLSVVDFGTLDESGGVAFLSSKENGDRKYALASWMSLEKDWVIIAPNKKEKIKITVLNKESLTSGGHYGAVLATVKSEAKLGKDMVGLNQSLASLIYIQKTGGEIKNLILKNVELKSSWRQFVDKANIRFENNGNIHLVPRGKVEVKSSWGKLVAKGIINEASAKILPESFRVFSLPIKTLNMWIWPGKYTAEISYRYDGKDNFVVFQKQITYVGREGVIMITIVLLSIVFLWLWKRRV